jgi:hypothetical protein
MPAVQRHISHVSLFIAARHKGPVQPRSGRRVLHVIRFAMVVHDVIRDRRIAVIHSWPLFPDGNLFLYAEHSNHTERNGSMRAMDHCPVVSRKLSGLPSPGHNTRNGSSIHRLSAFLPSSLSRALHARRRCRWEDMEQPRVMALCGVCQPTVLCDVSESYLNHNDVCKNGCNVEHP